MGIFDLFKKKHPKKSPLFLYTMKEQEQYEAYITQQYGPFTSVLHEIVSPDIHLDIILVPPTEKNPYYKLITMGMGAYKMNVPSNLAQYELERAELVIYLPPTWDIHSDEDEYFWPIKQLKTLGRLPINGNTWLGFGHTVSTDAENTPFADNTKFCSMMLTMATDQNNEPLDLRIDGLGKINMYQLFPLYEEELEYKQKSDAKSLLALFSDEDLLPVLNINRRNYGVF